MYVCGHISECPDRVHITIQSLCLDESDVIRHCKYWLHLILWCYRESWTVSIEWANCVIAVWCSVALSLLSSQLVLEPHDSVLPHFQLLSVPYTLQGVFRTRQELDGYEQMWHTCIYQPSWCELKAKVSTMPITWYHMMLYDITWCCMMSHDVVWCHMM